MESSSAMPWLSFRQKPRDGQIKVFEKIDGILRQLNVKLPTGYGKTFTMCGVYALLQFLGRCNRLLIIFPSDGQIEQFKKSGKADLQAVGITGSLEIIDIRFFGPHALRHHRKNTAQVFVTTVQALCARRGADAVSDLMQTGQWMVCVDEYHHYGIDKTWGKSVSQLPYAFLLAMSATPSRPGDDSAFGPPDVSVLYREAADENAVKPLFGHAYSYRVDAVMPDGEINSYTTAELVEEFGTSDPERIEKLRIKRKMRWSPKYVSPLISIPIERMLIARLQSGQPLQALVGAMCVSHAELVCKQIQEMYPDLRVDWVGTGEHGRSAEENRTILDKFCPAKTEDGKPGIPQLDVLVHVGMAGEGLDCVYVSEVVFLNNASICNERIQDAGRSSRYITGVVGNINFDSSSEFASYKLPNKTVVRYVGDAMMDAMDFNAPTVKPGDEKDPNPEPPPLPDEPTITILNMELLHVDSGDPHVRRFLSVLREGGAQGIDFDAALDDGEHPDWEKIIRGYRMMRDHEAANLNLESRIKQWHEAVQNALKAVAGRIVRQSIKDGRFEKSLPGDIKKRINTAKKARFGEVQPDVDVCRQHYQWLKELEQEIIENGVPGWLS